MRSSSKLSSNVMNSSDLCTVLVAGLCIAQKIRPCTIEGDVSLETMMGNCTHHEHILDRREVSHDVQDKVQVKHSFRSNHDPTALACASAVRRKTSGSSILREKA